MAVLGNIFECTFGKCLLSMVIYEMLKLSAHAHTRFPLMMVFP